MKSEAIYFEEWQGLDGTERVQLKIPSLTQHLSTWFRNGLRIQFSSRALKHQAG